MLKASERLDASIAAAEQRLRSDRYADGFARDPLIGVPLAANYHKRAVLAFARRDLEAALQDVDRALRFDEFAPYHTTRAVILDALGRTAAARAAIEAAFAADDIADRIAFGRPFPSGLSDAELARAHATRGTIALRQGDLENAARDLRRALELHETAAHAHAFGAALFARGDVEAASRVEARAVELEPSSARYRWALVVSLHWLGRLDAAREHARALLALVPEDASYRERLARLERAVRPWWRQLLESWRR